jgi:hypothetical protein
MKITKERLIEIIKEELEEAYGRGRSRMRFARKGFDGKGKEGDLEYEIGHEDRPEIVFTSVSDKTPAPKQQAASKPEPRPRREKRYIDFLDDLRYGSGIKPEEQELYDKVKADIIAKIEAGEFGAEHQLNMLRKAGG